MMFSLLGFGICGYLTYLWFMGVPIGTRPLLMLGILLLVMGCQIFSAGLIAEMVTYNTQKRSKDDIVELILNK